jgi:hypothetical protein
MTVASGPGTFGVQVESYEADADLSAKQFYFVKFTGNRKVGVCAAATDIPAGVLQNKPDASGKTAEVMVIGKSKVNSDGALTAGWLIGTAADGQADRKIPGTDTTEYVAGTVTLGSGAAGEMAEANINCSTPHRAA